MQDKNSSSKESPKRTKSEFASMIDETVLMGEFQFIKIIIMDTLKWTKNNWSDRYTGRVKLQTSERVVVKQILNNLINKRNQI